jgi:cobalamin biosynthesis Mg chelatase CobN
MIGAGSDWQGEINRNLASADIVLLLVSADFLASDYCWGEEMVKALQRHERGEARVIPVILRPCRWRSTPLAKLQAVPRDGKPVIDWLSRDAAFDDIAAAIERIIEDRQQERLRAAGEERRRAEAVARRKAEEEERRRAEAEAKRQAEEKERRRAEEEPKSAEGERPKPRVSMWIVAVAVVLVVVLGAIFVGFLPEERTTVPVTSEKPLSEKLLGR